MCLFEMGQVVENIKDFKGLPENLIRIKYKNKIQVVCTWEFLKWQKMQWTSQSPDP